jgi:hypothetical protein
LHRARDAPQPIQEAFESLSAKRTIEKEYSPGGAESDQVHCIGLDETRSSQVQPFGSFSGQPHQRRLNFDAYAGCPCQQVHQKQSPPDARPHVDEHISGRHFRLIDNVQHR